MELEEWNAVKLTIAPTIVPTGDHSAWARPHFRVFYKLAPYNQAAADALYSPYHKAFGPERVGHFIGTRGEWWFLTLTSNLQ